jgi:hypothetical protein
MRFVIGFCFGLGAGFLAAHAFNRHSGFIGHLLGLADD